MIKQVLVCVLSLIGLAPSAMAASRFDAQQSALIQHGLSVVADRFILPAYQHLGAANAKLHRALSDYCGGEAPLQPAKDAFAESYLAWQRASVIQLGPVMDNEGPMRFELWPDPKGFSRRAVRRALQEQDPDLLQEGGLEGRSIALVNLTALEDLIYGDLKIETYGCALSLAIAQFHADLAFDLAARWTKGSALRRDFDTADAGNETYGSVDEVVRALLAGMVVYSDQLRKFRIGRGLGAEQGAARGNRTPAVQSGLGLASIRTGFETLADLYVVESGFFDITPKLGATQEHYLLAKTFSNIAASLKTEPRSLFQIAQQDGAMAETLRGFGPIISIHEDYLKTGLPGSIGLTTGFTSSDGD